MEKSIIAKDITFKETLPIQNILSFYKELKSWGGQIFIIQNRKMVTCCNLPKLIAFLLVIDSKKPVKFIFEGTNAEDMMKQFTEKITLNKQNRNRYALLNAAVE